MSLSKGQALMRNPGILRFWIPAFAGITSYRINRDKIIAFKQSLFNTSSSLIVFYAGDNYVAAGFFPAMSKECIAYTAGICLLYMEKKD
jgi:hypothetical protein